MSLLLLVGAIGILLAASLAALALNAHPLWAGRAGLGGSLLAGGLGAFAAGQVLWTGRALTLDWPWQLPYASCHLGVDPLAAFFLLLLFALSAAAALFGGAYLHLPPRKLVSHWVFYPLFSAAMALALLARNGVLFLAAWEVMSVASFFLVTLEHESIRIQTAGWIYLVATHLGMACLLVLFLCLGRASGSLEFERLSASGALTAAPVLFWLAILGFGTKAGFLPVHVWLPEAHPAAPSHVSALMSGVMITLGLYGLIRMLSWTASPPVWWGYALLGIGGVSAILGAILALAQRDLKRLLAYSSVENVGIMTLGLGAGLVGVSTGSPRLAVLGFGGALLHILNHTIFKSLLFFCAGTIQRACRSLDLERLGGLMKELRSTGLLFFIGAAAICGLPPLNGFIGEFVIYLGLFHGGLAGQPLQAGILFAAMAGLALAGVLAAAGFSKAFGAVFLGQRRDPQAAPGRDPGRIMLGVMGVLALACVALGLLGYPLLAGLAPVVAQMSGIAPNLVRRELLPLAAALNAIAAAGCAWWGLVALLTLMRRALLAKRPKEQTVTWDCGYAAPDATMQYSASSFVEPITRLFGFFLRTRRTAHPPQGFFPDRADFRTETPQVFHDLLFVPLFRGTGWLLSRLRWLQHGRVQLYVLYILVALLVLLAWKLGA